MEGQITRRARNSSSPESVTRSRRSAMPEEPYEYDEEYSEQRTGATSQPVTYRIGSTLSLFLLFVALQCDVAELILDASGTLIGVVGVVIGYLKDIFALIFFPLVFTLNGAPFWKGRKARKKMIAMVTGYVVSLIPWVGAIMPDTFIAVAVTLYLTRAEDRGLSAERTESFVRSRIATRLRRGVGNRG